MTGVAIHPGPSCCTMRSMNNENHRIKDRSEKLRKKKSYMKKNGIQLKRLLIERVNKVRKPGQ